MALQAPSRSRRSVRCGVAGVAVVLLALVNGCGPGKPKAPPAAPAANYLSGYVGQHRILRFQADHEQVLVKKSEAPQLPGTCDAAVEVRTAVIEKGVAHLALETLGVPSVEKHPPQCKPLPTTVALTMTGFEADPPPQVTSRLDQVLPTPEGYLQAYGTTFDLASTGEPKAAASSATNAPDEERRMGRRVTAWPRRLLWVDPVYHDPNHKVHHEGEVEFEALVGADGRLYQPKIVGSLDKEHVAAIERVMPMWRFEPARAGTEALPAHFASRLVFRIY